MKVFGSIVLVTGALYYTFVNFLVTSTIYDFHGQLDSPARLFVQLDRYMP